MQKLSVVIITYNEERNIARCIDSVQCIADEILILDSYSKDNTKSICLSKGVRFEEHEFDGHIQQKNRAKNRAKHNWVLSLDADEAPDSELIDSIKKIKKESNKKGYYMNRLTNYCGHWVKHCGWYPDRKLRLWLKEEGDWTGTNPHDKFEMKEGDKVCGYLKGNIMHYSYYTISDHYKQVEYFTTIAAKAYFEKGKTANWFKLIVNPVAKFIDHFILKLGFLDGQAGYRISKISAYATWLKYHKLKKLQQNA